MGLFFYRSSEFQVLSRQLWGQMLFTNNTSTPETFSTFWDNICSKNNMEKSVYAKQQCEVLKQIPLNQMHIESIHGTGVVISDTRDPDMYAELDYRDSKNGELRGMYLAETLRNYASTHREGSVYDALKALINSHYHPAFLQGAQFIAKKDREFDSRAQDIAFKTIDAVLKQADKFEYDQTQYKKSDAKIDGLYPAFLIELDKDNIQNLKTCLESTDFQQKSHADLREKAIKQLLDYRNQLFTETKTDCFSLKDGRKKDKCHFAEQIIEQLFSRDPAPGQGFKEYVSECMKQAEEHLSPQERARWSKGIISHRLRDLIADIKEMKSEVSLDSRIANSM